jgi:cytochrome d ubiquinol oxidase subunit I
MEALAAFFLESTFIGLWLFGEKHLSPKLHLATIWAVAIGSMMSAYFILAANSWMQHPVGYELRGDRAVMTSIWEVLTNSTVLLAFPHTILGAWITAGAFVLAVSCWNLLRKRHVDVFSRSARVVLPIAAVAALGTASFGHFQAILMERQQPMKMAAAEALWDTKKGASFSLFATGDFERNPGETNRDLRIPHALSILSDFSWNSEVKGIDQIQAESRAKYGPGDYVPIVAVTYWTFRLMVGAGMLLILLTLVGLWLRRTGKLESSRRFQRLAVWAVGLPVLANFTGWIFTEMGRQPWVVYGLLKTSEANSPSVSATEVGLTLGGYTVIYGVLAAIGGWIALREIRKGPAPPEDPDAPRDPARPHPDLVLTY